MVSKFNCSTKASIENIAGGSHLYIGAAAQFTKLSEVIQLPQHIVIDISIDGLPLYKSSKTQFWPILIKVSNIPNTSVFPVGVFVGKKKPTDLEEFLKNVPTRYHTIWKMVFK